MYPESDTVGAFDVGLIFCRPIDESCLMRSRRRIVDAENKFCRLAARFYIYRIGVCDYGAVNAVCYFGNRAVNIFERHEFARNGSKNPETFFLRRFALFFGFIGQGVIAAES